MARKNEPETTKAKRKTEADAKAAGSAGLSMAELTKLVSSDPKLAAQFERAKRKSADDERGDRVAPSLKRLTQALRAELKRSGALTMADIGYLKIEPTSDGSVIFALKSTRSRDGGATERQSITGAMLRDHDVVHFQRKRGKRITVAESIAKMLDAAGEPHYFSDKSHEANGCTSAGDGWKCGKRGHGDQAQRQVLAVLGKLATAGWQYKTSAGKLVSVSDLAGWVA